MLGQAVLLGLRRCRSRGRHLDGGPFDLGQFVLEAGDLGAKALERLVGDALGDTEMDRRGGGGFHGSAAGGW